MASRHPRKPRSVLPARSGEPAVEAGRFEPILRSRQQRLDEGKALRRAVPLASHAAWERTARRRDPVHILRANDRDRLPELLPLRYGRMLRSPLAFLRGSASLMAHDLATSPATGIRVQACGDCHLFNFGLFATPERNLVFDINDFDETLPAPWEWDLKRLAASFVVASRERGHSGKQSRSVAIECARAYRERLRECSKMSPLEVWHARLDAQGIIDLAPNARMKDSRRKLIARARKQTDDFLYPKISAEIGGRRRLIDQPPMLFHESAQGFGAIVSRVLAGYRASVPDERRPLLERYAVEDFAVKAVGIGSLGTHCYVGLFHSAENEPLLLQFKEARRSVLEPHAGRSRHANRGQRVVTGQRLMQFASDIFLGWTQAGRGRHFYVRQLRDMKMSLQAKDASAEEHLVYAGLCGRTLAHAHAKTGDATMISGYLGKSDVFDRAISEFALVYADQNEQDHAALAAAVKAGRIQARAEEQK